MNKERLSILIAHNYYQNPGGEDVSVAAERALLSEAEHQIVEYYRHNDEIKNYGFWERLALVKKTVWASDSYKVLLELLRESKPDVAHFQNIFPLISPSAYAACQDTEVPVVQTLRNYRLLCPNAQFFRNGDVCEDCLGKTLPWTGVFYACYRDSWTQTAVVAAMLTVHRWLKTWQKQVDIYIALTKFARQKFIEGGFPAEKIVVKPNFVHPDPGMREGNGTYALFVGRLSPEKGIQTLLRAWQNLEGIRLKIAGDGPLMDEVQKFMQFQKIEGVEVLGRKDRGEVITLMKGARFLVFPSEWYETFGRVAIEAFACGVPVIASHLGAMAEIVEDGRTGLHFIPGDPEDLAAKVEWAWRHPKQIQKMEREARAEYEVKYTAEQNYQMLMDIYQMTIEQHKCFK